MIRPTSSHESGFSTIELLITLFIAAAFITTGYQLYSVIINNGSDARLRAKADNDAYVALRRYSPQATTPCTGVTPSPVPTVSASDNIPNATLSVTFNCPYGTTSSTTKVEVSLKYGSPQNEVAHALFVTK
jgi:Tfp pilus assembly protein PilE